MAGIHNKYKKAVINIILIIFLILVCFYIVPKIIMIFMPFVLGSFLALLLNPFVYFLERKMRIKRKLGSGLVMLFAVALICFLLFMIGYRLSVKAYHLLEIIPDFWYRLEGEFVVIYRQFSPIMEELPIGIVKKAEEVGETVVNNIRMLIGEYSVWVAGALKEMADTIPRFVMAWIMFFLSTYFFLVEKEKIIHFLQKYLPLSWKKKCSILKHTTISVTAGYFKAQLKIEIWVYLILVVGFLLLKVRYGYFIALPIAILDFLPVFGTGIVLLPWAVFKLLGGNYKFALGIFLIWGLGQLVRQVIQPKMMEESMGLASVPTLILLYLGYQYAGFVGMMVAVPLGNLIVAMNRAGFFENGKLSIRILWKAIHEFRQFSEDEE